MAVVNEESREDVLPPVKPCFKHNSLPTLLNSHQPAISWRYYSSEGNGWATNIWNAPNSIFDICMPRTINGDCSGFYWVNNVFHDQAKILQDLGVNGAQCNLQQVSWVIPNDPWSDHPGFQNNQQTDSRQIEGGPAWVANIVNTVGTTTCSDTVNGQQVPYWQDTAIFVLWDDWGGWWDHVPPYLVRLEDHQNRHCDPLTTFGCGYTSGFRVPLLVVSAYTPAGYVSGALPPYGSGQIFPYVHDFGSVLAFVENNFLGAGAMGEINPAYRFADKFAPDFQQGNIPLSDFFTLQSPRQFQSIILPPGAPSANYFINYTGPLGDPDNDVVDND